MLNSVILLSVIACALGAAIPKNMLPHLNGRIVGGSATTINTLPWQVALLRHGGLLCGGSVYSNKIIVTGAHCLQSASVSSLTIRAGSSYWNSGGVLINVEALKYHEGYNPSTMVNDIAVLRLSKSLTFGININSIGLASYAPANGDAAVISGWGDTSFGSSTVSSQLRYTDTKIVSRTQCASSSYGYGSSVRATMICAASAGKDICRGDSGGPLVSGNKLVGVASWGTGCALSNYPGVYSDVFDLRSWIVNAANSV